MKPNQNICHVDFATCAQESRSLTSLRNQSFYCTECTGTSHLPGPVRCLQTWEERPRTRAQQSQPEKSVKVSTSIEVLPLWKISSTISFALSCNSGPKQKMPSSSCFDYLTCGVPFVSLLECLTIVITSDVA